MTNLRYLVLGDIHANLQALDAVLADAARANIDRVLCVGDVVGYGADPQAVIARLRQLPAVTFVRGNHDKVCAGLEPATAFNDAARDAAIWTATRLSPAERTWLAALPRGPVAISALAEMCHGAPFDEDFYVFDAEDAERAMAASRAPLCFAGHTHLQGVFASRHEVLKTGEAGLFHLPTRGSAFVNVGSVGQPRDGDPRAAYGIWDQATNTIALRRVNYDVPGAQKRIRDAGLPDWLAARLALGR